MLDNIFKTSFLVCLIAASAIRLRYERRYRQNEVRELRSHKVSRFEKLLLTLVFVGMMVVPILYVLTPWLDFADYHLPMLAGWIGVVIFAFALLLLWRSHADLGRNWLATVELREGHALVTTGVYGYIRHPMYAAHLLWGIAQVFLLQNWVAGLAYLAFLLPLCVVRIPREERMMLEHFGEKYRTYKIQTGRFVPHL